MKESDKLRQQATDAQREADRWLQDIETAKRESAQRMHDYSSKIMDHERIASDERQRMEQAEEPSAEHAHEVQFTHETDQVNYWKAKVGEEEQALSRRIDELQAQYRSSMEKVADLERQASEQQQREKDEEKAQQRDRMINVAQSLANENQ